MSNIPERPTLSVVFQIPQWERWASEHKENPQSQPSSASPSREPFKPIREDEEEDDVYSPCGSPTNFMYTPLISQ